MGLKPPTSQDGFTVSQRNPSWSEHISKKFSCDMDSFFWLALETTQLQKNETCTREGIHDGQAQNASVFTKHDFTGRCHGNLRVPVQCHPPQEIIGWSTSRFWFQHSSLSSAHRKALGWPSAWSRTFPEKAFLLDSIQICFPCDPAKNWMKYLFEVGLHILVCFLPPNPGIPNALIQLGWKRAVGRWASMPRDVDVHYRQASWL